MRRVSLFFNQIDEKMQPIYQMAEDLGLLAARIYVSWVFLKSGLLKFQSWETTLALFEYEYEVPFLAPNVAAVMGTAGEIILPVLLIAGLFSRFSALGLFFVNFVAAISLAELTPAAQLHHINWAILLGFVIIRGGGHASLDYVISVFSKVLNTVRTNSTKFNTNSSKMA